MERGGAHREAGAFHAAAHLIPAQRLGRLGLRIPAPPSGTWPAWGRGGRTGPRSPNTCPARGRHGPLARRGGSGHSAASPSVSRRARHTALQRPPSARAPAPCAFLARPGATGGRAEGTPGKR